MFDQTPDRPQGFGYKVSWFAVRTSDTASVLNALQFGEGTPANWSSGFEAVYAYERGVDNRWIFLSPPVDGWVFAISRAWPYPTVQSHREIGMRFDAVFSRLMKRFDDVQFFSSFRGTGFVSWARAVNGVQIRAFTYGDEVSINFGNQTPEEASLRLVDLSGLSASDSEDALYAIAEEREAEENRLIASGLSHADASAKIDETGRDPLPGEEDVVDLAALWSIDPTQLEDDDHPAGVGLAVQLPKDPD